MQPNEFFKNSELISLIAELSRKYNIESEEATECITTSLAKAYNYSRLIINNDGSITGLSLNNKTSKFNLKHHNISKKIYKDFQSHLSKTFYQKSFAKIEGRFKQLLESANNIFYGEIHEFDGKELTFKLFDRNGNQIKNFYAVVRNNDRNLFKNEMQKDAYQKLEKGMLLYIPQREKIVQANGIFKVKAIRKHEIIVRYKINTLFKTMKKTIGISYGYKKCFIDLKRNKIVLMLNMRLSEVAQNYLEESLKLFENFEYTYLNKCEV